MVECVPRKGDASLRKAGIKKVPGTSYKAAALCGFKVSQLPSHHPPALPASLPVLLLLQFVSSDKELVAEFKEVIRQNNEKGGPKPKKGTKNPSLKFNDPLYAVKEEAEEGAALSLACSMSRAEVETVALFLSAARSAVHINDRRDLRLR